MSYINEALKKAQEEKSNRYGHLDYALYAPSAAGGKRSANRGRRFVAVGLLVFAGGLSLVALLVFYPSAFDGKFLKLFAKTEKVAAGAAGKRVIPEKEKPVDVLVRKADAPAEGSAGGPSAAEKKKRLDEEKKVVEIKALQKEAVMAGRKGNFSQAGLLYKKALTMAPENVEILNNLGVVYLAEKKREEALALFRRAILLKRDYVDPYYNMACLYAQKNDIDQSLWYLKIAISMNKEVKNWIKKDADMKVVMASPKFKKMDGGAKN